MAKKFLAGLRSVNVRGIEGVTATLKFKQDEKGNLSLSIQDARSRTDSSCSEDVVVRRASSDGHSDLVHAKLLELVHLIEHEHHTYPDDPMFVIASEH